MAKRWPPTGHTLSNSGQNISLSSCQRPIPPWRTGPPFAEVQAGPRTADHQNPAISHGKPSYPLSAMPASRRITSTHSSTPARLVSMTLSAGAGAS